MGDRDCNHGQLARQCDRCELEGEVEGLRAFVAAWDAWHIADYVADGTETYAAMMVAREAAGAIEG